MNEDQKKAFENALDKLPRTQQEAVRSYPWEERVVSIGTNEKLYLDQINTLLSEVALVLSGITPHDEFEKEVMMQLHIDETKAAALVRALNAEIIMPIHEIIKKQTPKQETQFTETTKLTTNQTIDVFKVAPETHTITPKDQDPYREPII